MRRKPLPWLRTLFGSLGIKDIQFVLAVGTKEMNKGNIDRAKFLAPHVAAVQALFAQERIPIESTQK
jgi:FMN-dependent NADH-azoreductase